MKEPSVNYPKNLIAAVFGNGAGGEEWVRDLTSEDKATVNQILESLTPLEEACLRMWFERGMTLQEIADYFPKTSDDVEKKLAKGLRKLRHPARSQPLRAFLKPAEDANQTPDIMYENSKRLLDAIFGIKDQDNEDTEDQGNEATQQ